MVIAKLTQELYAEKAVRPLYHYTSLDGVIGIVKAGALRATEIRYFSDAAEMKHTVELLSSLISYRNIFADSDDNARLLEQFRKWVTHRVRDGHMLFLFSTQSMVPSDVSVFSWICGTWN
jgi:hypothetical protein